MKISYALLCLGTAALVTAVGPLALHAEKPQHAGHKQSSPPPKGAAPMPAPSEKAPSQAAAEPSTDHSSPASPTQINGPPLDPERAQVAELARRLRADLRAGRLTLTNPDRDGEQLQTLECSGVYLWPPAPPVAGPKPRANSRPGRATTTVPSRQAPPNLRAVHSAPTADPTQAPTSLDPNINHQIEVPTLAAQAPDASTPDAQTPNAQRQARSAETPNAGPKGPDAQRRAEGAPVFTPPSPALLRMLTALAAHSTPAHPLEVLSLLRPPYRTGYWQHVGPRNPHSLGLAADIAMYAGHRVRQDDPEACVAATLALLRDLPPGRYRMGMPKAPEAPAIVGQPLLTPELAALLAALTPANATTPLCPVSPPASFSRATLPSRHRQAALPSTADAAAKPADRGIAGLTGAALGVALGMPHEPWPFFPAPEVEVENGLVAPLRRNGKSVLDASGQPVPHILRFRNESYAPADALGEARVKAALKAVRKRGVEVIALFPDAADHVHIDVQQQP